jgi:hypothetical protein
MAIVQALVFLGITRKKAKTFQNHNLPKLAMSREVWTIFGIFESEIPTLISTKQALIRAYLSS